MEMEEDMDTEQMAFEVREIDLEYEFDAARWYDLSREESPAEARATELWFETAQSYPPSPFAEELLLREDASDAKIELSTKSEDGEEPADVCDTFREIGHTPHHFSTDVNNYNTGNGTLSGIFTTLQGGNLKKVPNLPFYKGPTYSNHVHIDKLKCQPKRTIKQIPRSSTLMRPTASQLAKQNHVRLNTQVNQISEKGFNGSSGPKVQAAKRQKIEGGLHRKIADVKQEINFVHKTPKKDVTFDKNLQNARMKLTIPQEPELATAQRAHRTRTQSDVKSEQASASVHRFKARPFIRKIFEAPSLPFWKKSTPKLPEFNEFHLKTSERAMQHSSAVTTTTYHCNDSDKGSEVPHGFNQMRPSAMDISKQDVCNGYTVFKARPLNKKILSSKGDIGILRNNKRETTVPLEFNFHTEKRTQPDLPTELFSKLSLTSELRPSNGDRSRLPRHMKGSKENRVNSSQKGHEVTNKKFKGASISRGGGDKIKHGNNGTIPEINQRSLGIR